MQALSGTWLDQMQFIAFDEKSSALQAVSRLPKWLLVPSMVLKDTSDGTIPHVSQDYLRCVAEECVF